jgi:hypothetical protein
MAWLDHFSGGLLTTCGLQAVGSPSRHDGIDWPLHGSISNLAADHARWSMVADPEPEIVCAGVVREASALGPNLLLSREFRFPLGGSSIRLSDRVRNEGYEPIAIQVLYHLNLGWPFTTDQAAWTFPPRSMAHPLDGTEPIASDSMVGSVPVGASQLFRHRLHDPGDELTVRASAPVPGYTEEEVHCRIGYRPQQLPALWSWVDRREGRSVVGIEPALGAVEGRAKAAADGLIKTLPPGGERSFGLTIELSLSRPS